MGRKRGFVSPQRRTADSDFLPSLRLLVCRERYSLTDIGMMFGVSRERVRQWLRQHHIEHPDARDGKLRGVTGLHCVRVWDDALHRFVPVQKRALNAVRADLGRRKRVLRRAERRAHMVACALRLKAELGRDPHGPEIARVLGSGQQQPWPFLLGMWGQGTTAHRGAELREALRVVGIRLRVQGEHLRGRRKKTHLDGAP